MRRFARFACIDWSGEAVARPRGIALAECGRGEAAPALLRPAGGWSRHHVLDWLVAHGEAGTDMLIGIDFSPSLPFADRQSYFPGWAGAPRSARGLWAFVDDIDDHLEECYGSLL